MAWKGGDCGRTEVNRLLDSVPLDSMAAQRGDTIAILGGLESQHKVNFLSNIVYGSCIKELL